VGLEVLLGARAHEGGEDEAEPLGAVAVAPVGAWGEAERCVDEVFLASAQGGAE
jgi:hypothetical protein